MDNRIQEILEEQAQRRQEEVALNRLIESNRLTRPTHTIPIYAFTNKAKTLIGLVQDFGELGGLRLTTYNESGPLGDSLIQNLDNLGRYLRDCGFIPTINQEAAQILEVWAVTDRWANGVKQSVFIGLWNELGSYGRYDLARLMDAADSLDEGIKIGKRLLKEVKNATGAGRN